jgi:hypothetical protein
VRISEIANAEEQVGLLKIIMDKTWEAIATQQRQQAAQAQQKAAPKPKQAKPRSPKAPYAPPPPKLAKPPVAPQLKQQAPMQQQVKPQAKVAPFNKSIQAPPKASSDSKDGFLQQISNEIKKGFDSKDRHS